MNEENDIPLSAWACAEHIIEFLKDRKGFDGWWYSIDGDIQTEITTEIAEAIRDAGT